MLKKVNLLTPLLLLALLYSGLAFAQVEYTRRDRAIIFAEAKRQQLFLSRMAELAELSSDGGFSSPQLMALANEFQALKIEIDHLTQAAVSILTPQSNAYRATKFSTTGLGIANLSIDTSATTQGQANNRMTLDSVNAAIALMNEFAANDWQHVSINGSINNGTCAGGFAQQDARYVRRTLAKAASILVDGYKKASEVLDSDLSRSQRFVVNADLEFLKEDLEILGESNHSLVQPQTATFLRTIIDPVYLNIVNEQINAPTLNAARQQALHAKTALAGAYQVLINCG